MNVFNILVISFFILLSCNQPAGETYNNRSEKDTCDNPDGDISCLFRFIPSGLTSRMIITEDPADGARINISGTIFKEDGSPFPDIIMYAYHTDKKGLYSKKGNETGIQKWHGYLHGWCMTDQNGKYEIHTIRPAPYPDNTLSAHIHTALKLPDGRMFYISDFLFADDPLLEKSYSNLGNIKEDGSILTLIPSDDGILKATRDIVVKIN